MPAHVTRNKAFLRTLFAGPFPGHGFVFSAPQAESSVLGDFTASTRDLRDWIPTYVARYEAAVRFHDALGDDSVPYVGLNTNTGVFANAFGCKLYVYSDKYTTNACAIHCVDNAAEADALPEGDLNSPALSRTLELAKLIRAELGPEVPIGVPDIQSPFDMAALIWKKEDLLPAMIENPPSVHELVGKCTRLLKAFIDQFRSEIGEVNLCHCPEAWAPPDLGLWLSEDEVGAFSTDMFEEFCLPVLADLSGYFGGLFLHCCAEADHQYGGFLRVPNLRGLNRVWTSRGPKPAIDAFAGKLVLIPAWLGEEGANHLLDLARPNSRFLFNISGMPLDAAKAAHERLMERCPRTA